MIVGDNGGKFVTKMVDD